MYVSRGLYALSWTRDPFDRLITAHALAWAAPLLSRDAWVQQNYAHAFWDTSPATGDQPRLPVKEKGVIVGDSCGQFKAIPAAGPEVGHISVTSVNLAAGA